MFILFLKHILRHISYHVRYFVGTWTRSNVLTLGFLWIIFNSSCFANRVAKWLFVISVGILARTWLLCLATTTDIWSLSCSKFNLFILCSLFLMIEFIITGTGIRLDLSWWFITCLNRVSRSIFFNNARFNGIGTWTRNIFFRKHIFTSIIIFCWVEFEPTTSRSCWFFPICSDIYMTRSWCLLPSTKRCSFPFWKRWTTLFMFSRVQIRIILARARYAFRKILKGITMSKL